MRTATIAILTSLALLAPTAVASHYDPENGVGTAHTNLGWGWNAPPIIDLEVEWVGIGGEGGEIQRTGLTSIGADELNTLGTNPGPDDCADLDEVDAVPYALLLYLPSVALRPPASEGTILEEQSVEAPAEVDAQCRAIRELAWAQDPNHQWATPGNQKIGIGKTRYSFDWVFAVSGTFNGAFRASHLDGAFTAPVCPITNPVFSSGGDEGNGNAPNGLVAGDLNPADCIDTTQDYQDTLVCFGTAWDAGSINNGNGGSLLTGYVVNGLLGDGACNRYDASGWSPGLYVQCFRTSISDLVNDIHWTYEEYAYVWIDEVPFLLAPSWGDPNSWDGRSGESHCSDVNPNWPYFD